MNLTNKELQEKYHDLEKEYKDFAYIVSHDISAPLRQVKGFLELIFDKNSQDNDQDTEFYYELMNNALENGQSKISSLLLFSRANIDKDKFSDFNIYQLLDEIKNILLDEYNDDLNNSEISFDLNIDPTLQLYAHKDKIKQAFYNILDNSIKYRDRNRKPEIVISLSLQNNNSNFLAIEFSDNGLGIKETFQKDIFTIFRRGWDSEEIKGNGIGLSIAKKIIDQHLGTIYLDHSGQGKGSKFIVKLPL
jgi:signal transduction histidine kinase